MNKKTEIAHPNTYSRLLLSDWDTLAELIIQHSTSVKQQLEQQEQPPAQQGTLTQTQIDVALQGPYSHFLQRMINAHSKVAKLKALINLQTDDQFKGLHTKEHNYQGVAKDKINSFSVSDLDKLSRELSELAQQQHNQWQEAKQYWQQLVIEKFTEVNVDLADVEIQDLLQDEILPEILARYTDLQLDTPKFKGVLTFEHYFYMLSELAIISALSRQHQSHQADEVKTILKKFKNLFNQIKSEVDSVDTSQQAEINDVLSTISFMK